MQRVIIAVPKGYDAIKIEVPFELVHLLKTRAVKLSNYQSSNSTIIFDELLQEEAEDLLTK